MYKQSNSRNQRSKGIKVKHILQICLLLVVCFWLIYQVKHSHDKKKEFDEDELGLLNTARKDEVVKLGRKHLDPQVDKTSVKNEKHNEEVEEEEAIGEDEENKNEDEEQEDNKTEEKDDDEGNGNEEEQVDDQNQEKSDSEIDREEDILDDEKDKEGVDEREIEEKDSKDNLGQAENDNASQDHDHEGAARNTHEAREENYKADDASSAVTHVTLMTTTSNDTGSSEKSNEQAEVLEHQNTSNNTDERNGGQNTPVKVLSSETAINASYSAATANEGTEDTATNSSVTLISKDLPENQNNLTEVSREDRELSLLNGNGTSLELNEGQRVVEGNQTINEGTDLLNISTKQGDNSTLPKINNYQISNSTIYAKSEEMDSARGEFLKLSGDTESSFLEMKSNESSKAEDDSGSSKENNEAADYIQDDGTGAIDENINESNSHIVDDFQHDPIDSSDSSILLEKDIRTDLETLPDIQTEGSNREDAAAE